MTVLGTIAVAMLAAAGCGSSGPPSRAVSGSVTFKGQPVPAGLIVFAPDAAAGTAGPMVSVPIRNGRYTTADTKVGPSAGAYRVTITGFDGDIPPPDPNAAIPPPDAPPAKGPRALFPTYTVAIELPDQDSERNFDVPTGR